MVSREAPPRLLVLAAGIWLGMPFIAPLAAAKGSPLAVWLYLFFSPVCHQNPARSFHLLDHQVAVCHRCLGLYAGLFAGLVFLPLLRRLLAALSTRPARIVWFAVPMALDVALPFDFWSIRFLTGLAAGFPVALVLWLAAEEAQGSAQPREGET